MQNENLGKYLPLLNEIMQLAMACRDNEMVRVISQLAMALYYGHSKCFTESVIGCTEFHIQMREYPPGALEIPNQLFSNLREYIKKELQTMYPEQAQQIAEDFAYANWENSSH